MMITENKVDVKYGSLFPWPFQLIAAIVLLVGLSLIVENTVLAVVLMVGSTFVLSGYEGTEIDRAAKTYREYKSFFLFKSGEKVKYSGIEKIFINTSKTRQQVYTAHTTKSSIFENVEFNGFLKFNDATKIQLIRKKNKVELVQRLEKISRFLDVPIEDNTRVTR